MVHIRSSWRIVSLVLVATFGVGWLGCSSSPEEAEASEPAKAQSSKEEDASPAGEEENTSRATRPEKQGAEAEEPPTGRGAEPERDQAAAEQRVRHAMQRSREEFERGHYHEAMRQLETVAHEQPVSEELAQTFRVQANMTRTFQEVLGQIEPLNHRREMLRVVFHGGGSTEGFVLERRRDSVLLQRYGGGYERIDTRASNVYALEELSRGEQRDELARRFETLEQRFRLSPRGAAEIARFAREARRHDLPEEAHNLLLEAFALDPWIDQTLALEDDADFVAFRHATQSGERDTAAALLAELRARYPRAALFRENGVELAEATPEPEPGPEPEPESEPESEPADAGETTARIFDEVEEEAEKEADEARRTLGINLREEVPEVDELDAQGLLRRADSHRERAKEYERGSSPGRSGSLDALDKAIYHYRLAQELYRRALDAGADEQRVNPRLTDVNRGLFWARRSRPID